MENSLDDFLADLDHIRNLDLDASPERRALLEIFDEVLVECSPALAGKAAEFISCAEAYHLAHLSYETVTARIIAEPGFFGEQLQRCLGHDIRRLLVLTVPSYMETVAPHLADQFDQLVFVDNFKSGKSLGEVSIETMERWAPYLDTFDAVFIATRDPVVIAELKARFKGQAIATYKEVFEDTRGFYGDDSPGLDSLIEQINNADNPTIIIGGNIISTLDPTYRELEKRGRCFFFVRKEYESVYGYGLLSLSEITYQDHHAVGFDALLKLLKNITNGRIVFVADSVFSVSWNAARSLINYAYAISLVRLARQPVILLLYDAVKPLIRELQWANESARLYRTLTSDADGLIFNSNDRDMSEFVINSSGVSLPHINFYRYSTAPAERLPRLEGGIHLVAASLYLGDFDEPSRNDIASQIVSLLEQGIHFHYYSEHSGSSSFMDFLPASTRSFLHVHPIQRNQERLVQELTRYWAGWMTTDWTVFPRAVALIDDSYFKEIFTIFPLSTVSTSSMAYNCAGLPIITNRTLRAIRRVTGEETIIAIESSEIPYLGQRLKSLDWQSLWEKSWDKRKDYDIATHIDRLSEFIDGIEKPEIARLGVVTPRDRSRVRSGRHTPPPPLP